jgi:uncharacterized membrane protein
MNERLATILRVALVLAYPVLAHIAGSLHDGRYASLALADLALIALLRPLLQGRAWAWTSLGVTCVTLAWLGRSGLSWNRCCWCRRRSSAGRPGCSRRTLRGVPLITRMVAGLDGIPAAQLSPALLRYTRNLTVSWAVLLSAVALVNLLLALLAVPDGLLASNGISPPVAVSHRQWSWATALNFALMIGFFLVEFAVRQRRFPGRYRNLWDFLRRISRLGPAFWRDIAR